MSDCCEKKTTSEAQSACCCGTGDDKIVLLYSCSGSANVGEIADQAARELMFAGHGAMFCLAGLGGDIQGMVQAARDADVNLLIEGCPMDCAKKTFDRHGITNYTQIRITDLGIEKVKGVRCTKEQVDKVVAKAKDVLSNQK